MGLTFADYLNNDKKNQVFLEMAMYQGNNYKIPIVFNKKDLEYLQQFPSECWMMAMWWRYSSGLLKVAQAWENQGGEDMLRAKYGSEGDVGPDMSKDYTRTSEVKDFQYPDREDVIIKKWATQPKEEHTHTYTFPNIRTGLKDLWIDLQKKIDPEWLRENKDKWDQYLRQGYGLHDYDLTEPLEAIYVADDEEVQQGRATAGEPIVARDPPSVFNRSFKTAQLEAIRRNLRAWTKVNELRLAEGDVPDEWTAPDGKSYPIKWVDNVQVDGSIGKNPTGKPPAGGPWAGGKALKYKLPCIKIALPGYQIADERSGEVRQVPNGAYYIPVLLPGTIFAKWNDELKRHEPPIKVKKDDFILRQFNKLDVKGKIGQLRKMPLVDHTARDLAIEPIPVDANLERDVDWQPRNEENLKKFIRACKEELRLSDKWIVLLDDLIDKAGTEAFQGKISIMNLCRATNPRAFGGEAGFGINYKAYPGNGRPREDIDQFTRSIPLLHDEDQQTLRDNRIALPDLVQHYGTPSQTQLQAIWVTGGINNSSTDYALNKKQDEERIKRAIGEDVWAEIYKEYTRMAWGAVQSILAKSGDADRGIINTYGESLVQNAVMGLILSAHQEVNIPLKIDDKASAAAGREVYVLDEKKHKNGKRQAARVGVLKQRIQASIARLKRHGIGADSLNKSADPSGSGEPGAELGDLAQKDDADGGMSDDALSTMGHSRRGKNRFQGVGRYGAQGFGSNLGARQAATLETIDKKTMEENWGDVESSYRTILEAIQSGKHPSLQGKALSGAEAERKAASLLKSYLKEKGIQLKSGDSVVATLYQTIRDEKLVLQNAPAGEIQARAREYTPDTMKTDPLTRGPDSEQLEIQQDAIDELEAMADDGMMVVPILDQETNKKENKEIDLTKVSVESKEHWIGMLMGKFERAFVPKEEFHKYFPAIVEKIASVSAGVSATPKTKTPDAVSPQGQPAAPAAQPSPRATTARSPATERGKTMVGDVIASLRANDENAPRARELLKSNAELRGILTNPTALLAAYPEDPRLAKQIQILQSASKRLGFMEMSLPIGYPDLPNGKYSDKIRGEITRKGAQAWGAAGSRTGGLSPIEDPITKRSKEDTGGEGDGLPIQKWTSLKEHLNHKSVEIRKRLLKERVEKEIENAKSI